MVIRPAETGAGVQRDGTNKSPRFPAQGPLSLAPTFLPTPGDTISIFTELVHRHDTLTELDAKDKLWEDLFAVIRGNISLEKEKDLKVSQNERALTKVNCSLLPLISDSYSQHMTSTHTFTYRERLHKTFRHTHREAAFGEVCLSVSCIYKGYYEHKTS